MKIRWYKSPCEERWLLHIVFWLWFSIQNTIKYFVNHYRIWWIADCECQRAYCEQKLHNHACVGDYVYMKISPPFPHSIFELAWVKAKINTDCYRSWITEWFKVPKEWTPRCLICMNNWKVCSIWLQESIRLKWRGTYLVASIFWLSWHTYISWGGKRIFSHTSEAFVILI